MYRVLRDAESQDGTPITQGLSSPFSSVVGWSWILSNLKTIPETGHPLPPIM